MNFGLNLDPTNTAIPTRITWKWRNTVTNQVWRNGAWGSSSTPDSQIWPLGDSSDGFAQRWQWNVQQERVEARYRSGGAPDPFTPIGTDNLLQNFFQGQGSVSVVVDVKVEFQDGSTAETTTNTITVRPSFSSEIVTAMVMKADGQQLSHLYGRAGTLPNLEWTVTTSTALPNQVQVGIFKQGGTQIACQTLESATSLFTQITPSNGPNGKIYTLTAQSASGLFTLLSNQGAGRYEVRFSGAACSGGDWSGAQVALITLNPNLAFRLRFHYRDHLGSSTVSRAYTPEYQTGIAGAATFSLKMSALGNQFVTLYAQPEKTTNFTPFGKPMGDVNEEPNPRYTDHEFDAESGLNYMKGRYQLANFAKFNRPDPMRDWDWENPSSINLYQYVRNNPIDSWDPDGFQESANTQRAYQNDLEKVQTIGRIVDQAKKDGKNPIVEVAKAYPGEVGAAILIATFYMKGASSVLYRWAMMNPGKVAVGEQIVQGTAEAVFDFEMPGLGFDEAAELGTKAALKNAETAVDLMAARLDLIKFLHKYELGFDAAKRKFSPVEAEIGSTLESIVGPLARSRDGAYDWIDQLGRTYDAVGPVPTEFFRLGSFTKAIYNHLLKQGLDKIVVNISSLSRVQRAQVEKFISSLSSEDINRIIIVR